MFAVIMAGGAGTRFWPASNRKLPKQFLKIFGGRSLLEETLDRIRPLAPGNRIFLVVNESHQLLTAESLKDSAATILLEPIGRNTAACIGLAATHISRVDAREPIVALPADHFVADAESFRRKLAAGVDIARSGAIVTLGVSPDRPETGFGYVEAGDPAGVVNDEEFFAVKKFVEKPDLETAIQYVTGGRHLWNSGVFIFTAETILGEIQLFAPRLHAGLNEISRAIGTTSYGDVVSGVYGRLESISIDYAVMEKTDVPIYALKGDFGWSDVGSWQALYDLHRVGADPAGNVLLGRAVTSDAKGNLVYSTTERHVALVGVEGLAVVDTADGLLVTRLDRSQDVKRVPELLKGGEGK